MKYRAYRGETFTDYDTMEEALASPHDSILKVDGAVVEPLRRLPPAPWADAAAWGVLSLIPITLVIIAYAAYRLFVP